MLFYKKEQTIYVSGAAHIFTGLAHYGAEKDTYYPDTLYIRLFNKTPKKFDDFPFNIAQIKILTDTGFYKTHADAYIYPIKIPGNYEINSIEKFLTNEIRYDEITEAVMYGYPDKLPGIAGKCILYPKSDSLIRFEENPDELDLQYKIKSGSYGGGCSGSPLFLKTNKSRIIFGGICVGGYSDGFAVFVPHSFLIKSFNR